MRNRHCVRAGACKLVIVVPLGYHHISLMETAKVLYVPYLQRLQFA